MTTAMNYTLKDRSKVTIYIQYVYYGKFCSASQVDKRSTHMPHLLEMNVLHERLLQSSLHLSVDLAECLLLASPPPQWRHLVYHGAPLGRVVVCEQAEAMVDHETTLYMSTVNCVCV